MVEEPETRYALSGEVHIAYQVVGEGPFDLVFVPGFVTHMELQWKLPGFGAFLAELGSFSRLIRFDKRGTGMSEPVSGAPNLETRMDDVRAVMDAVGSSRAAFYGLSEGAAMSILFAATDPERTAALIVRSCSPRTLWAPDFPWGRSEDAYQHEVDQALQVYESRTAAREAVRTLGMRDGAEVEAFIDFVRYGSEPRDARCALSDEQGHRRSCGPLRCARAHARPARRGGSDRSGGGRCLHRAASQGDPIPRASGEWRLCAVTREKQRSASVDE